MTHRVHDHGERCERASIVEAKHFHPLIVGAVRVEPHDRSSIDDLSSVNTEFNAVLSVTDSYGFHRLGCLFSSDSELVDQQFTPVGIRIEPGPE